MNDSSRVAEASATEGGAWQWLLEALHRYRYALAPISFGVGLASFLLIERREWLAQWLAVLLVLGWLLLIAEETAVRMLRLPLGLVRYGLQAVQQETFFFALPFFLHTTSWSTGQGVFTGVAIVAALCSMWDPLYYGVIARRPWLYIAFHTFSVFIGTLVIAPLMLHLTTTQTLAFASVTAPVLAVPSLLHIAGGTGLGRQVVVIAGAVALSALAWWVRPWVPPATLWVREAVATDAVDASARKPNLAMSSVSAAQVRAQGLYAFTAIHAPRGLREQVYHRWLQNGHEVDRIPIDIRGGRDEGYRAWSYKRGFPADPRGAWQVQVVTDSGQLIGAFDFDVVGETAPAEQAPVAPPEEPASPAAPGGPEAVPAPDAKAPPGADEQEPPPEKAPDQEREDAPEQERPEAAPPRSEAPAQEPPGEAPDETQPAEPPHDRAAPPDEPPSKPEPDSST